MPEYDTYILCVGIVLISPVILTLALSMIKKPVDPPLPEPKPYVHIYTKEELEELDMIKEATKDMTDEEKRRFFNNRFFEKRGINLSSHS